MAEMKNKFNQQVAAKSDLQEQLINSEEEKLNVSKALIDLQIENTKLNEQMLNSNQKINTDLLHTQEELQDQNIKEERASRAIAELQDKLIEARNDRKDFEIELIALKKNYWQTLKKYENEKAQRENVGIELINLVNENKSLQSKVIQVERAEGEHNLGARHLEQKASRVESQLQEARLDLLKVQAENDSLRSDMQKFDIVRQQNSVDVDNKKMELERQYLEMTRNRQMEVQGIRGEDEGAQKRFKLERELWEGEKTDLHRRMKELQRRLEEVQDDVKIVEETNNGLKLDKQRLN